MGKITTYIAIMSMVILGFHFAGLIEGTPTSWFIKAITDPSSLSSNSYFAQLIRILAVFSGGAIIIGSLASNKIEQGATISFTLLLFLIGWDLIAIFNVLKQTNQTLAIFMISPMLLIYMLTVIEWWRGRD